MAPSFLVRTLPYTRKLVSKFPSFPRAHHPIIRDSTSIWEFTGQVLVQVGHRNFRDSCIQVCKSRLLSALFCSHLFFFAEVRNLYPLRAQWKLLSMGPVEIGFATSAASAKSLFWYSAIWLSSHFALTQIATCSVSYHLISSFPFLPIICALIVQHCCCIDYTINCDRCRET